MGRNVMCGEQLGATNAGSEKYGLPGSWRGPPAETLSVHGLAAYAKLNEPSSPLCANVNWCSSNLLLQKGLIQNYVPPKKLYNRE